MSIDEDFAALEALVVDNPDLDELEARLEQFNIFEALNTVRVEVRHSDFLAFLLNPNQNHGLGDAFAKKLLQKSLVMSTSDQVKVRPLDLDLWDLDDTLVYREMYNIDILLIDGRNPLALIIENKIKSGEHGDQLKRYREIVKQQYPTKHLICLFLTPDGEEPSDNAYIGIDYKMIADIVDQLVESRSSTLGPDIRTLMTHYSQMLRRHIVSESKLADLCRDIYLKHQRALDLIYEYRPDLQGGIRSILDRIVLSYPELILDTSSKSRVRFVPKNWDTKVLLQGNGWTPSGRMLLFEFANHQDRLNLNLVIGPGPEDIRQKLLDIGHTHRPLFNPAFRTLGKSFNTIFQRKILTTKSLEDSSMEELEGEILDKWDQFLNNDLPKINEVLQDQNWIWEK